LVVFRQVKMRGYECPWQRLVNDLFDAVSRSSERADGSRVKLWGPREPIGSERRLEVPAQLWTCLVGLSGRGCPGNGRERCGGAPLKVVEHGLLAGGDVAWAEGLDLAPPIFRLTRSAACQQCDGHRNDAPRGRMSQDSSGHRNSHGWL